jgi:hypothetical protein
MRRGKGVTEGLVGSFLRLFCQLAAVEISEMKVAIDFSISNWQCLFRKANFACLSPSGLLLTK